MRLAEAPYVSEIRLKGFTFHAHRHHRFGKPWGR
jgi:hypothetical protein